MEIIILVFDNHILDVGAGNLLNALLDPILIFLLGLGIGGAAISTVISEYVDDVVKLMCLFNPNFMFYKFSLLFNPVF